MLLNQLLIILSAEVAVFMLPPSTCPKHLTLSITVNCSDPCRKLVCLCRVLMLNVNGMENVCCSITEWLHLWQIPCY